MPGGASYVRADSLSAIHVRVTISTPGGSRLSYSRKRRKHVRRVFSYAQEITRLQFGDDYADAVRWMGTLPYYLVLEDAIVVHAAVEPGVALADQRPEILCGSTAVEHQLETKLGASRWCSRLRSIAVSMYQEDHASGVIAETHASPSVRNRPRCYPMLKSSFSRCAALPSWNRSSV